MNYYRLRFGEEASKRLNQLKGRTGLTPISESILPKFILPMPRQ